MATVGKVGVFAANEVASNGGWTHYAVLTANDLTVAATNTLQTLTLMALQAGDIIEKAGWRAKTYFSDASDAAYNDNTMSIGDVSGSGVASLIAAIQVNLNHASEVKQGFGNTAIHYAAADTMTVTVNSMSAKSLVDIDAGEIFIVWTLIRLRELEESVIATAITV